MSILTAEKINKSFGDKHVLRDISLTLEEGEFVSILGVSGGGKTTLFNVLSGLFKPESGKVSLYGEDITGKPGKISYMLQKDLLLPFKRVIDNAALPLVIKGKSKNKARLEADKYFKVFGLDGTQMLYPYALSGGMRQRAALLRTYLASDGVVLLDEPFSALDAITRAKMQQWYLGITEDIKLSTLFITHDIDEAILLSDRVCVMSEGRIETEIRIDYPRPRNEDFTLSDEFLAYKRKIKSLIK
ncbi:MAG: ABC transporter ATP-binding protein [Clostridia bacterium]|nr:ABC transporter ATP-binding protein [Clostridia bacterium]